MLLNIYIKAIARASRVFIKQQSHLLKPQSHPSFLFSLVKPFVLRKGRATAASSSAWHFLFSIYASHFFFAHT